MTHLYGIKNCDTVRAARRWLDAHDIDYEFVDVREQAVDSEQLSQWLSAVGESLLNKRSTTWKQLDESTRKADSDQAIVALLAAHPTLIKRPVLETGKTVKVGFAESDYAQLFKA